MSDDDRSVTISIPLEKILVIVRELKLAGIKFEWYYTPRSEHTNTSVVKFVFDQSKWASWFILKYY